MVPAMLGLVKVNKTCHWASESLSKAVSPLVSVRRGFLGVMCQRSWRVGWARSSAEKVQVSMVVGMSLTTKVGGVLVCVTSLQRERNDGTSKFQRLRQHK